MSQHATTPRAAGLRNRPAAIIAVTCALFVTPLASGCAGGASEVAAAARAKEAPPPDVDAAKVISQRLDMAVPLPGELAPYEEVRIFPKVTGFVQWIGVDRGSHVKRGELLAVLLAPEIRAQKAAAQAQLQSAENRQVEGAAKLASDESTYRRLKVASQTSGVISDEELEVAEKTAEADRARVVALRNTREAAAAALHSVEEIEGYLRITAPFDGVVTKRNVHPGALVGPAGGSGAQSAMLRIEEVSRLRLVVAVPEAYVASVQAGAEVNFTVPAFPGRTFTGTVARLAESIDVGTRTMPVEMDVWNSGWELHAGMFPQVMWPVHRRQPTLFVPQSAVGRSMEDTYVVRIHDGRAERVSVKTGATSGNLTEVFGGLLAGDEIALRASEDLRPGTAVAARWGVAQR